MRAGWALLCLALAAAALVGVRPPATADTAPPPGEPSNPATTSVNPLPTVQIGQGVVWTQTVIGNTVYVGGEFSTARPAGSPAGTNQVTRSNLLAYDIRTGVLSTAWAPSANGAVDEVVASPDGERVYVAGSFTTINGTTRRRIAALDADTGALIGSFNPNADSRVRDIAVTATTVYFGGNFGSVGGQARSRLAATRISDGALLPWAPNAQGGGVQAMEASPDGSQILVAGQFTTMNGSGNPGYGLASLHPVSGALLPWAANAVVRNAGANASLTDLVSDGDSVYGTGYHFGSGGTLEGTARMSWNGGAVEWIEDCHGDVYSVAPIGDAVYTVGHAHYCGNVPGGYSQSDPWKHYRALAYSRKAASVLRPDYLSYPSFAGQPAPAILHWFPELTAGTFTGQTQAAWAIDGNEDYVVAGGEFPRVNGVNQQGLVRFARVGVNGNANNRGPDLSGAGSTPVVTSHGAGEALISWRTNWDRDNRNLTYKVIRGSAVNSPIHTTTVGSTDWDKPHLSFLDTGQPPGSTQSYRIFATDPFGNESRSNAVSVTIAGSGSSDAYARSVMQDGPMHYWRLGESSGATAADWTGRNALTLTGGVARNASGAVPGDAAATWNGTSGQTAYNSTAQHGPFWFSVETWFRTTSSAGGKIVGFGDVQTGSSGTNTHDRHLYMDGSGRINFGTRQSTFRTVTSPGSYRDGQWHHAVGVVGDNGMSLYVDGARVGQRTDTQTARSFTGYWRVGGDNIGTSWPNRPSSSYFAGSIDEVAVYTRALTGNEVRAHYLASGRSVSPGVPSDSYGKAVHDAGPDAYWRLAETSGSTAVDSSRNGASGGYVNGPSQGQASAVGVGSDRSVGFDGTNDLVSLATPLPSPTRFATELWFRTDSDSGGRLVGFGNARTGSSTQYDRHVFMTNAGRLRFGVLTQGGQRVVESPTAYNDGSWHHLVAQQGPEGMAVYVDGLRVADGPESGAQSYSGYWRLGGDNLSGWTGRPSSDYFDGSLDEAAFYSRVLSPSEILDHFDKGGGTLANAAPVAEFTAAVTNLSAQFDSATSTDVDGTIESYAWDFGDGGTSTEADPQHSYALPGTYTVTLTVTDDDGATDSVTHQVTTSEAPTEVVLDTFTRSVVNGWGTADVGGAWTTTGPANRFAAGGGRGTISLPTAGLGPWAYLNGVSEQDTDAVLDVSTNVAPTGSGIVHSLAVRRVGTTDYRAGVRLLAGGSVQVSISRVVSGAETKLGTATVPGLTFAAGDDLRMRFTVSGASPTTLEATVWRVGDPEPAAPHLSRTDSTAGLQGAGSVGVQTYVYGNVTTLPVVAAFDNVSIG